MWRIDLALMWTGAILALLTVVIPMLLPNEVTPLPSSSHPDPTPYRALVVGSTGAVGRSLVRFLADSYQVSRVGVVVRHHPQWYHPKESERARHVRKTFRLSVEQAEKVAIIPIQFEVLHHPDAFESYRQTFSGWDKGFSAIGTTMRQAGSPEAFRLVDLNYTLATAALMRLGGVHHLTLISSIGANINSSYVYPQTKGEIEHAVSRLGFPRVSLLRPSVLLTPRPPIDSRPLEHVAQALLPRLHWALSLLGSMGERIKAVSVDTVAAFARLNAESKPSDEYGREHEYGVDELVLPVGAVDGTAEELARLAGERPHSFVELFENEVIRGLTL